MFFQSINGHYFLLSEQAFSSSNGKYSFDVKSKSAKRRSIITFQLGSKVLPHFINVSKKMRKTVVFFLIKHIKIQISFESEKKVLKYSI